VTLSVKEDSEKVVKSIRGYQVESNIRETANSINLPGKSRGIIRG
jgi:hypothetical protein